MSQVDRNQLRQYIDQVSFAMDDVVLYLDTHTDDRNALNYYERLRTLKEQAVNTYTNHFGALTAKQVKADQYWTWASQLWPWEVEG